MQTKRQKELAKLKFLLSEEKKYDKIVKSRDDFKEFVETKKQEKAAEIMQKQAICRDYHEQQMQKLADLKAIQAFKSKQIAEERKQQKEYELMLQKELDEELKNMK